eukprot:2180840-Alexandrium_andersonii.AAC.1
MVAPVEGWQEPGARADLLPCSCCLWPQAPLDRRSRCRFCAILRRSQRLQSEYRVHTVSYTHLRAHETSAHL